MEELLEENKKLKERIEFLERQLNKGSTGNTGAYNIIRLMIKEKIEPIVPLDESDWRGKEHKRTVAEKKVMSDLKWDLRIRTTADFRVEHVEKAKEYIANYKLDKSYMGEND